jgi:hypothetical protein
MLCSHYVVNGPILAAHMLVGAILANEADGGLSLELQEERKLLSSGKRSLRLVPLSPRPRWSGMTLEDALVNLTASARSSMSDNSIAGILSILFGQKPVKPWVRIVNIVEMGLASNNWLIPVNGSAASAFTTPFICPARVRDLVVAQPEEPIVELLKNCRTNRPMIWELLRSDVARSLRQGV